MSEIEAGAALDARIDVEVFGNTLTCSHGILCSDIPPYSSDIGGAWLVVDHLMPAHAFAVEQGDARRDWMATFRRRNKYGGLEFDADDRYHGYGDTAALAICRAALLAVAGPAGDVGGTG